MSALIDIDYPLRFIQLIKGMRDRRETATSRDIGYYKGLTVKYSIGLLFRRQVNGDEEKMAELEAYYINAYNECFPETRKIT